MSRDIFEIISEDLSAKADGRQFRVAILNLAE